MHACMPAATSVHSAVPYHPREYALSFFTLYELIVVSFAFSGYELNTFEVDLKV